MDIKTLGNTSVEDITVCFNAAFADYFVKFNATPAYFRNRWHGARVNYDLSVGAFDNGKLVGFMLHGIDTYRGNHLTAFNVGTGVLPSHRGQRLVKQMYAFILPFLKKEKITQYGLEVIQENTIAIKAYESIGLEIIKNYPCFSGEPNFKEKKLPPDYDIQTVAALDWQVMRSWWECPPSFEQLPQGIERTQKDYQYLGVFKNKNLVGYGVFSPKSGAVPHFAVHPTHRRQGLATVLFQEIMATTSKIKLNNIDDTNSSVMGFTKYLGIKNVISQYEMLMRI